MRILHEEFKKKSSSLVVIRGRRRIGKSRLIEEFGNNLHAVHLSGLPPTPKISDAGQRHEFATQMAHALRIPVIKSEDWSKLFWHLARVEEIREKLDHFSLPRGFSIRCVLVHVNGVTEAIEESPLIDFVVDFSQLII